MPRTAHSERREPAVARLSNQEPRTSAFMGGCSLQFVGVADGGSSSTCVERETARENTRQEEGAFAFA
jgi:hypothetical protein